jgi:shikimate dehydrogenase
VNQLFGLIGFPLGHSWSKKYFEQKFRDENINYASYELFPIKNPGEIRTMAEKHPELNGINVTIPYKTTIIPFLDDLDSVAREVNAVNTIRIQRSEIGIRLEGYNTDVSGFGESVKPLLRSHHRSAMILGTGGAAKAAAWVFAKLGIDFMFVSRTPNDDYQLGYHELSEHLFEKFTVIVNATPLGMAPHVDSMPPLPYHHLSTHHLLFDMVYNPSETKFLAEGRKYGAEVKNGLEMLHLQAEKAWEIWNSL